MATVLNLLDVMNKVLGNDNCSDDNEKRMDTSMSSLIFLNAETLKSYGSTNFELMINEDPQIVCKFQVYVHERYYIDVRVNFMQNVPDSFKCKLSLYHLNLEKQLNILGSLDVGNITENSTFNFMKPLQVFVNDQSSYQQRNLFLQNVVKDHVCLVLQIIRKDSIKPLEVKIPQNEMGQQFYSLYENKTLTDFKIICNDNQEFLAHKVVLAARSPVFKAMFEHEFQESQKNEIKISEFQSDTVEQMLRYIYTDNIENLKQENVEALLAIANKYALKKLQLLCLNEISKSVKNITEALDALLLAEKYNVTELKEGVVEFIENNRHIL